MQSNQEPQETGARARGTVRKVAENNQALIMTDAGSLTIVRQLYGKPFVAGDYLTGLTQDREKCLVRNETTRAFIAVMIDALAVPPELLPRNLRSE